MLEYKTMSMCASSDYCRGWNDAVKEMPKWISVKERMPPLKEKVLVWAVGKSKLTKGKTYCDVTFTAEVMGEVRWWEFWLWFLEDWDITHWMPLPEAPKTLVFSKKKWMECQLPKDVREDALQSFWVDECDGKPVENGQCGQFLIVDTWCVDADEWEAYEDK